MDDLFLDPAMLRQWLAGVERRLAAAPGDARLERRHADLLRALGDLEGARAAYGRLAGAGGREHVVLSGAPADWADAAGPAPFVRLQGFLDEGLQDQLWAVAAAPGTVFKPGQVFSTEAARLDRAVRQAQVSNDDGALRAWFLPLVEAAMSRERVRARLGLDVGPLALEGLQLTRHGNEGFYRIHRDSGGPGPLRRMTFVYNFHRRPRRFSGGDLVMFDQTVDGGRAPGVAFTRLEPLHNSLVMFPSDRLHAVTPVRAAGGDPLDDRWTVIGWMVEETTP